MTTQTSSPLKSISGRELLELLGTRWRLVPVAIVLVLIWIYFATQSEVFLSPRNLTNLSIQIVVTTMLAAGLCFPLLIGEIDLSVAASAALSAAIMAWLIVALELDSWLSLGLGLVMGLGIGVFIGSIVVVFRAPSFIVTLGLSLVLQGLLLQVLPDTNLYSLVGTPVAAISTTYLPARWGWVIATFGVAGFAVLLYQRHRSMHRDSLDSHFMMTVLLPAILVGAVALAAVSVFNAYRGVPLTVTILLVVLAILSYVTTQMRFGLYLYATGANQEAARRSGIPVNAIKIAAFAVSGVLIAGAGMIAASRVMAVSPQSADESLLLEAIAAAVIGGVSIFGGRGSIWAPLIGALLIGSVSNGLLLVSASTETRLQVQGGILIIAVIVDAWISRSGTRRG
jgi:D-xylose transport system permease protein